MRTSHRNSQGHQLAQGKLPGPPVPEEAPATYTQRLAASLDVALASHQVVAKVGMRQQDNLLYVTLEPAVGAATEDAIDLATGDALGELDRGLDPRSLLPLLQSLLADLKLSWLKLAKVSARLPGQSVPLWRGELLFQKSAPIAQTLMNPKAEGLEAAANQKGVNHSTGKNQTGKNQTGAIGDVTVHVGGNMSGQIIIGKNNRQDSFQYTYHVAHGGVLNVAPQATVRLRPMPVRLRPRPFENLLDRRTVLPMFRESLWQGLPVEVYSAAGFGKTSLMRHMAHDEQLVSAFPDGVVYLSAHRQLAADVLQSLYDAFYETSPPLKPSYGKAQQALARTQALVILNHLSLEKEEMDWLMAALPACTFVLVSVARFYWQEGAAIALKGLPLPESIALIQIELGRALSQDEQYAAKSLWAALSGNPLQLRRAAAQAKADDESLMVLVQSMQAAPGQTISARSLFQKMAGKLSARQQSALTLMGAMGGVALSAEQSQAISQDPAMAEVLNELADLHLVETASIETASVKVASVEVASAASRSMYQLSADLVQLVPQQFSVQPWLVKATNYFVDEVASQSASQGASQASTANAMLHLLEWTQKTGQWQNSLALARRLDCVLALNAQWDQWQQVLTDSVQAAEQLGDGASKAWALHQLGTRALALGEYSRADSWLSRALRLREDQGDLAGAAVTRHNLAMMTVPLVSGNGAVPLDPTAFSSGLVGRGLLGGNRLPWRAGLLLGAVTAAGLGAVVVGLRPGGPLQPPVRQVMPSDTALGFGERPLTSVSEPQGVVFTNSGPEPLEIRQLLLSGEGDFALAAASASAAQSCQVNIVLAAGEACEVTTTFTPTTVGKHTGEIVMVTGPTALESDAVETRVKPVALSGTGIEVGGSPSPGVLAPRSSANPADSTPADSIPNGADAESPAVVTPASDDGVSLPIEPARPSDELVTNPESTNPESTKPESTGSESTNPESTNPSSVNPDPTAQSNQAPVAIDYNFTIEQGEPLTINLLNDVFDPDGDVLSLLSVANLNSGGQLERDGKGSVTYLPRDNFPAGQGQQYTDSFEYTVSDGKGGTGQGVISVTVIVPPLPDPLPTDPPPTDQLPTLPSPTVPFPAVEPLPDAPPAESP